MDDNPGIVMLDIAYVNDTSIIRRQPKMTAINSCIEIDITGQIVSDSIGTRTFSGVGGQMDFIRGASVRTSILIVFCCRLVYPGAMVYMRAALQRWTCYHCPSILDKQGGISHCPLFETRRRRGYNPGTRALCSDGAWHCGLVREVIEGTRSPLDSHRISGAQTYAPESRTGQRPSIVNCNMTTPGSWSCSTSVVLLSFGRT
jgi:hypothetical protein